MGMITLRPKLFSHTPGSCVLWSRFVSHACLPPLSTSEGLTISEHQYSPPHWLDNLGKSAEPKSFPRSLTIVWHGQRKIRGATCRSQSQAGDEDKVGPINMTALNKTSMISFILCRALLLYVRELGKYLLHQTNSYSASQVCEKTLVPMLVKPSHATRPTLTVP
jgi:hypothetical protein